MATQQKRKPDSEPEPQQEESGKKPAQVFSYHVGKDTYIQASVWAREVENNGSSFTTYDVSVRKRLKSGNDWTSVYSFRASELPALIRALSRAEDFILETRKQEVPF